MSTVKVGQVWADGDKRMAGRKVRVVETKELSTPAERRPSQYAICEHYYSGGRKVRIRTDRMKPPRWVLVEDVKP